MRYVVLALCPIVFVAIAWKSCDRALAKQLRYKVPLSLRWSFPSIRRFWFVDLLFACLAFGAVWSVAGVPLWALHLRVPYEIPLPASDLAYLVSAAFLGLFWPKVAVFSPSLPGLKMKASIARLRDLFLGGPAIDAINAGLQLEVESYLDRIVEIAGSPTDSSASLILKVIGVDSVLPAGRTRKRPPEFRQLLAERARDDFWNLYQSIARVKMVPLVGRPKPLMRVPDISWREEQKLHDAGIASVWQLAHRNNGNLPGISEERGKVLKRNAQELLRRQVRVSASALTAVTVLCCAIGLVLAREDRGKPGPEQRGNPALSSPQEANAKGAYPAPAPARN